MNDLKLISDSRVPPVFDRYPEQVRSRLENLRRLILEAAAESEAISSLEETLKWGEPSYLAKQGSTLRIDWKEKAPNQYAMYFKCTSKLVPTFKTVFDDQFSYEGNRAIVFQMEDSIPEQELKQCITAALRYHTLKHLPLLGL